MKCLTESLTDTISEMDCQEIIVNECSTWLGVSCIGDTVHKKECEENNKQLASESSIVKNGSESGEVTTMTTPSDPPAIIINTIHNLMDKGYQKRFT